MLLCVDGGATKTHVLIAEEDGTVVCEGFGEGMAFSNVSFEQAFSHLQTAISSAISKGSLQKPVFSRACLGIAGIDTSLELKKAQEIYLSKLRGVVNGDIMIVNDIIIGIAAATISKNAIGLIAGTGSSCFGYNDQGQKAKAGGLDYMLSEGGSAYFIGQKVLETAVRSWDGRGEKTILEELVLQHFDIEEISELKSKVYGEKFKKSIIGKLSFLANQAAQADDMVAKKIMQMAFEELLISVMAVARKLNIDKKKFDLILIGGLFENNVFDIKVFSETIRHKSPGANVLLPKDPAVYGALRLLLT
jgi:N-acetylglucosamine kinase-like BadF-type ATPase